MLFSGPFPSGGSGPLARVAPFSIFAIRLHNGWSMVRVLDGDTECPLQVCQMSRSSESTRFLSLRRDVAFYYIPPEPRMASEIGGTCLGFIS